MTTPIAIINIILVIYLVNINLLEDLGFQIRDKSTRFNLCVVTPIIVLVLELAVLILWKGLGF